MNHYAKREAELPLWKRVASWLGLLFLLALMVFFFWIPLHAQERSNTYYAAQFAGADVGAKITAAQAQCSPNTAIPCIIVIDAILAGWPQGTSPALCAQCTWIDYRSQGQNISKIISSTISIPTTANTLPATIVNDTAGGIFITVNSGKIWQIDNTGALTSPKGIAAQLQGATSGFIAVVAPAIAGTNTLTLPAATDTLVGKATTDTLTNKTFDTAGTGNVLKIGGGTVPVTKGTANQVLAMDGTGTNLTFSAPAVSESTWSTSNQNAPGLFVLNSQVGGTVLPSAHTLVRYTIFLSAQESGCSTAPVFAFRDVTAASNLATLTVTNATTLIDSGVLSVAMTAGDQFAIQNITAGVGCTGGSSGWTATVVFK